MSGALIVLAVVVAVANAGLHYGVAPILSHSHSAVVVTSLHQTHPSPILVDHGLVGVGSPLLVAGHGIGVHGYKAYPPLAPGSGLEGQWVPDHIERHYDDGSYKGEIYHRYLH